jgi:4-amino-4-deoxy-L-arabinose transferase-like glycosyltransferase
MAERAWWFRPALGACLAIGAVVRLAVYLGSYRGAPLGFNDAEYYSQQAVGLTRGRWFVDPASGGPGAEHGPLTSIVLAPASWMSAGVQDWQRLVTVLTGLATVLVLGLVGRRLGGPLVGVAAAGLAALYPNLWLNDGLVMSESVAALAVSLWVLAGVSWHQQRSRAWTIAFGLAAGAAVLARSELVVLVAATIAMVWWAERGAWPWRAGLAAAAAVLVVAPWVVPNLVRFERPVVLTTNFGTTLRGANCDRTYAGRALGSWSVFCLVIEPETVALEPSLRSERWRTDGITYARDHAKRLPVVIGGRVGRSLDLFGLDYQVDEDVRDGRPRWASWAGVGSFWILAPLALVGIMRWRVFPRRLLVAPVLAVALSTVVLYGGHRIRAPVEPIIVLAAAGASIRLLMGWRGRRQLRPEATGVDASVAGVGRPQLQSLSSAHRYRRGVLAGSQTHATLRPPWCLFRALQVQQTDADRPADVVRIVGKEWYCPTLWAVFVTPSGAEL